MNRLVATLVLACICVAARATTVIPPSFDELVQESELVFRGRVTAMRSGWSGDGPKARIATWVTFAVERILQGEVDGEITLEFIGGTVGTKRFEATGWPQFEIGDRGVFFVENRKARLCPLVALRHGRYRIVTTEGSKAEYITRDDHTPLRATADVAAALSESGAPRASTAGAGLSLAEFESQIVSRSRTALKTESSRR